MRNPVERNPVMKFMEQFNKPKTERDRKKYRRKPKHKQKEEQHG